MAQKRILVGNKFVAYNGPKIVKMKLATEGEKIQEKVVLDVKAKKHGFSSTNPAAGGLSESDIVSLEKGMSLTAMMSLAETRGVDVPETMETKEEVLKFLMGDSKSEAAEGLSEESIEQIKAGISLPEMRALAKAAGIKIPGSLKKKDAIQAFLAPTISESDDL